MMPGHWTRLKTQGETQCFRSMYVTLRLLVPKLHNAWRRRSIRRGQELQAMGHVSTASFRATATREKLACRILELADDGEDDPSILKDYAVAYFIWPLSPAPISSQRGWLGERP